MVWNILTRKIITNIIRACLNWFHINRNMQEFLKGQKSVLICWGNKFLCSFVQKAGHWVASFSVLSGIFFYSKLVQQTSAEISEPDLCQQCVCVRVFRRLLTCHALTTWGFEYPTACPYQGHAEYSCVEIQFISGESRLDPHGECARWEPNRLKNNIRPVWRQKDTSETSNHMIWGFTEV